MDISFKENKIKFNFRVAALIVSDNKWLFQKADFDSFWGLIGGRVHLGETTIDAINRELIEEINVKVSKDDCKLIRVVENFFKYNEIDFHEILFIYKIDISEKITDFTEFRTFDKDTTINKWFEYKDVLQLNVLPIFIKSIINNDNLKHTLIIGNRES